MSATSTATPNGLKLLEAVGFNRHIAASLIATRKDWKELLDSIPAGPSRKNVAAVVYEIRTALGLEADHAFNIFSGEATE